jgi:hypothetical protein
MPASQCKGSAHGEAAPTEGGARDALQGVMARRAWSDWRGLVLGVIALGAACSEPKLNATGNTCQPVSVNAAPMWVAPPIAAGVCSVAQLSAFRSACFEPATANQADCSTWSAANTPCFDCAFSPGSADKWGALVAVSMPSEVDFTNVGGCIYAMSPTASNKTCAQAVQAQLRCDIAACSQCPVADVAGSEARQEEVDGLNSCFDAANSGTCQTEATAALNCVANLSSNLQATCAQSNTNLDDLFLVMDTMCAAGGVTPGPFDGGVAEADGGVAEADGGENASPDDGGFLPGEDGGEDSSVTAAITEDDSGTSGDASDAAASSIGAQARRR